MKMAYASRIGYSLAFFMCLTASSEAKKLTVPQINLLNLALGTLPQVTARLKLSLRYAQEVCDVLEKNKHAAETPVLTDPQVVPVAKQDSSKQALDAHLKKMFEPVREFFSHIIEHKDMVVPLIVQSLGAYPSYQAHKTLAEASLLLAFFNEGASTKDIVVFFQGRVASQQELDQLANELKYFLDDLFDSFSQHVLQAYEKMMSEIQAKKGSPSKQQLPKTVATTA